MIHLALVASMSRCTPAWSAGTKSSSRLLDMSDATKPPPDWEHVYAVTVDGRTLEAMKFLASFVLESKLPSLSAIGAADCVLCFQESVRRAAK